MGSTATEEQILEELHKLDPEQWPAVLDFITFLEYRARLKREQAHARPLTADALLRSGLVGLWAGRDDLSDSEAFARRLREEATRRRHSTDDPR
jgi:hypothetical protein